MKRILTLFAILFAVVSCSTPPKDIPVWTFSEDPSDVPVPNESEKERTEISPYTDMVLIYGFGTHRTPYNWSKDYMGDYVVYSDPSGKQHWLFDAFLCLEFMSPGLGSEGKTFITGYKNDGHYMESANKGDWYNLIDYYFKKDVNVGAIDAAVGEAAATLGAPPHKRQIVIGVPEPIEYLYNNYGSNQSGGTTYWGEIDGEQMDFSRSSDRLKAMKWYIDTVREKFYAQNYQNVELGGFYITAERSDFLEDVLPELGEYVASLNYSFNWIPYFKAAGYDKWKRYGFTYAFMQPNYFFQDTIPYDRLVEACEIVIKNGMGLEIEFDGKVQKSYGWGYRLRDYMKCTKDYGVWENSKLVYYQGSWAVRWIKRSSEEEDRQLYEDFCQWVISRPLRDSH